MGGIVLVVGVGHAAGQYPLRILDLGVLAGGDSGESNDDDTWAPGHFGWVGVCWRRRGQYPRTVQKLHDWVNNDDCAGAAGNAGWDYDGEVLPFLAARFAEHCSGWDLNESAWQWLGRRRSSPSRVSRGDGLAHDSLHRPLRPPGSCGGHEYVQTNGSPCRAFLRWDAGSEDLPMGTTKRKRLRTRTGL